MNRLSIIVPVYNVQNYIDECINSIVEQSVRNIEVILVDDGSTDQSGNKCDLWKAKYSFIKVIHKENGGLSSARNIGLDNATGDYILFVDSDDKVYKDSFKALLQCINESNADYYFLKGRKFYPDGIEEPLDDSMIRNCFLGKSSLAVIKYLSTLRRYPGSSCTKAYRRDFLICNNLRFPSDRRLAEDLEFTLKCILYAESYDCCEHEYYLYRQSREGSITSLTTGSNKSFWNLAIFLNDSISLLSDGHRPKGEKEKYALSLVAYEYTVALVHLCQVTERSNEAYALMRKFKWLKKYLVSKRGKIISLMLSVFGIRLTSKLLSNAYIRREKHNNI